MVDKIYAMFIALKAYRVTRMSTMKTQIFALIAAVLLTAAILPTYTIAFATTTSDEPIKPTEEAPTTEAGGSVDTLAEMVEDVTSDVVSDIIKDDPVLSAEVEVTATAVIEDFEVPPAIDEGIANVTNDVANAEEPTDVIVTLSGDETTAEILEAVGNVNDTDVVVEVIADEIAEDIIANNTELAGTIANVICTAIIEVITGETTPDAAADNIEGNVTVLIEDNVSTEDIAEAADGVDANSTAADIITGEADVVGAVGDAAADNLETPDVEVPVEPEPEPTDGGTDGESNFDRALRLLEEAIALLKAEG